MSSNNSYAYYNRFIKCLCKKYGYEEPEWSWGTRDCHGNKELQAILRLFDYLIERAPSACMGADDWLDRFFLNADGALCTGMWCFDEHCESNDNGYPYNCKAGYLPSKCKTWKAWRKQWRSYPEKEECQKCRYYKPEHSQYLTELQTKEINSYKCYCRKKELPDGCPKKVKEKAKGDNNGQ